MEEAIPGSVSGDSKSDFAGSPAVGRRVPLSTFCSKQRAILRTPNTGAATASYHVLRARRGARAPPGRLIRVRIQVSLAVLGDFGASEAASPSPEGFRTAGHKKGTLPRSSIIHVQGSLGICRLRKGGRECAYQISITNRSNRFEYFLAGACGWLQTSAGMNDQLQTSECGPSVCMFTARS